jgi:hypothetical protein
MLGEEFEGVLIPNTEWQLRVVSRSNQAESEGQLSR